MNNNDIVFRRIRGRIVPISSKKIKTGKPRLPKKIHVEKNNDPHWLVRETVGGILGAGAISGFGLAVLKYGEHTMKRSSRYRKASQAAFEFAKKNSNIKNPVVDRFKVQSVILSKKLRLKSEKLFKRSIKIGEWGNFIKNPQLPLPLEPKTKQILEIGKKIGRYIMKRKGVKF